MSQGTTTGLAQQPAGFLRLKQVLALYPVSSSSWWNGVKDGRFPAAVRLGPHMTAWRASDIAALLERVGKGEVE